MLKNLDEKLRRFEEISHASSVVAENAKADTMKSFYTGAFSKQLQFNHRTQNRTLSRAGKLVPSLASRNSHRY